MVRRMVAKSFGVTSKQGLEARCWNGHEDSGSVVLEPRESLVNVQKQ
jgi:hypothetical protein